MLQILYYSAACKLFEADELDELLVEAQQNNAALNVTGMLLYADGAFFQILEGPDDAVRDVYAAVQRDTRHQNIIKMLEREIAQRDFPDWSMGFKRSASLSDLPPAFFQLSKDALARKGNEAISKEVVLLMGTFLQTNTLQHSA